MYLKRAILVNWGNIPHMELDFGPVNLFSGGNGSGKTTAADAIQALMTAAHENLFAFNPGQDETTQRGRGGKQVRTLASYLLGCDDGSFARLRDTDGYVVGVFHPTDGENSEPFSAIMAMRGHLDSAGNSKQARLDELFFLILPAEQLSLSHFVRQDKSGKYLVPIDQIGQLLKREFGAGALEVYDKKGAYLRRLYGALRGRRDAVSDREAKHAARTFAGFMAYKPVKSIHDFVAQEILEPKDLGEAIRNVSDLMKTIHQMESSAAQVKHSITILERGRQLATDYSEQWLAQQLLAYSEVSRLAWVNQQGYLALKQQQKTNIEQVSQTRARQQEADAQRRRLHQTMVQLEARRQGVQVLREQDQLREQIAHCQTRLVASAQPLARALQQLQRHLEAARGLVQELPTSGVAAAVPELGYKAFTQVNQALATNRAAAELDMHSLLNRDWIDQSPLEAMLQQMIVWQGEQDKWLASLLDTEDAPSVRERLHHILAQRREQRQRLQGEQRRKEQELQLLRQQQIRYPAYVEQALRAIREQCPGADPQVLCDFVEISDSVWQMAIEGYMGGARFGIIVAPEHEADAIRAVRRLNNERPSKARVIQGGKAQRDARRLTLPEDSIVHLMVFGHSIAEDYLAASYGQVLQVADAQTLKHTARGLTPDGLASGNYSLWRCDLSDSELVFGQGARQRALAAKEQQFQQLCSQLQAMQQDHQSLEQLVHWVDSAQPVDVVGPMQDLLETQRDLHSAEQALLALDVGQNQSVDQELEQQQKLFESHQQQCTELERTLGGLLEQQKQLERRVAQSAQEQDALNSQREQTEQVVLQAVEIMPRFDAQAALLEADQSARSAGASQSFVEAQQQAGENLRKIERQLFETVQVHNQHAPQQDQLIYQAEHCLVHSVEFFRQIATLQQLITALHTRLKHNILVDRHRQLSQLKDSFNTAFVTNLCHSIYQAINEGQHTLEDLNRELEHHRFGSDRERFYFDFAWVPEYQEYWQFFKALINMPNLGDGTTLFELDLPAKHARTRDRLLAMLLHEDEQTAFRELARISDYRNYRRYEIYKQPENKQPIALSQYGTGSGGQLETPAYIIRAAAVTSAFRFNEGKSHWRMVMVDEAFSKMDESRSREVIRYLTDSLGLQLIFIMPTSKSGPFLDIISNQVVFTKCPTQEPVGELRTRVLVDRKICQQEQIAQLWAKHRAVIRHQASLDFMQDLEEA